jgi:hypothetical protein
MTHLRRSKAATGKYILDTFPHQIYLEFPTWLKAEKWIEDETNWVKLVRGFTPKDMSRRPIYILNENADYAEWNIHGDGYPPTFFFREEKHALWFKLNWKGVKEDPCPVREFFRSQKLL